MSHIQSPSWQGRGPGDHSLASAKRQPSERKEETKVTSGRSASPTTVRDPLVPHTHAASTPPPPTPSSINHSSRHGSSASYSKSPAGMLAPRKWREDQHSLSMMPALHIHVQFPITLSEDMRRLVHSEEHCTGAKLIELFEVTRGAIKEALACSASSQAGDGQTPWFEKASLLKVRYAERGQIRLRKIRGPTDMHRLGKGYAARWLSNGKYDSKYNASISFLVVSEGCPKTSPSLTYDQGFWIQLLVPKNATGEAASGEKGSDPSTTPSPAVIDLEPPFCLTGTMPIKGRKGVKDVYSGYLRHVGCAWQTMDKADVEEVDMLKNTTVTGEDSPCFPTSTLSDCRFWALTGTGSPPSPKFTVANWKIRAYSFWRKPRVYRRPLSMNELSVFKLGRSSEAGTTQGMMETPPVPRPSHQVVAYY